MHGLSFLKELGFWKELVSQYGFILLTQNNGTLEHEVVWERARRPSCHILRPYRYQQKELLWDRENAYRKLQRLPSAIDLRPLHLA